MSPNVLVAPNRNNVIHYVLLAGTGCTHLLALYCLMVFIHETHVMPSSGKVKTKKHLLSYLVLAGSECCPMCQLLKKIANYHIMCIWLVMVAPIFWQVVSIAQCVSCSKQEQITTLRGTSTGCTHLLALY